jgi:hypothetical protein
MLSKVHKKKYIRFTDSVDDDNNSEESDNDQGNIDLIINKLENKVSLGNINSGNADVILKKIPNNQEIIRSSKNGSFINNISNLLQNNIKEKDIEISQNIGNSIISVNSNPKGIKISPKPMIDVDIDISLNSDLKDALVLNESKEGNNKYNIILSTNNSNTNSNTNFLSRNNILGMGGNNILRILSTHLDNSRFFINKKTKGLITTTKMGKENKEKNEKDINLKMSIDEEKSNDKEKNVKNVKDKTEKNKTINKNNNIKKKYRIKNNSFNDYFYKKYRRKKWRNCNYITILRNIFITIIIVSSLAFYATIFILG